MSASQEYAQTIKNFRIAALVSVLVLGGGVVFYHFTEGFTWVDSLYFCTITLTTIGYGDIVPTTTPGKLFTVGYVLIGVGIIAAFANLALKRAVIGRRYHEETAQARKAEAEVQHRTQK